MHQSVHDTIERYRMLAPGHRVGVAVSGGADSVCLLHVLQELRLDVTLSVLHLDHALRGPESDADADFVRCLAASLGLPFEYRRIELARARGNLEQAARQARLDFFLHFLRSGALDRVATGHTLSDQAETVLFRFLRGSGAAGLAGIRPVTADGIVRPLLEIDRDTVRRYLAERNLPWREDSSNSDLAFDRNRIRRRLLPELAAEWNPAIAETLAHTARWALDEEAYWSAHIDALAPEFLDRRGRAVLLDVRRLCDLPPAVARRLLRRALEMVKGDLRGIDFRHVEAILAVAASTEGHGRTQAPGIDIIRSFEWLRLAPPDDYRCENRDYNIALRAPGCVAVPLAGTAILLELIENPETKQLGDSVYNSVMGCMDGALASTSLEVRNWRPGDQYQPIGQAGVQKIKSLFQQFRVPLWERRYWPVVTAAGEIAWSRRFGPAAARAARPEHRVLLKIREVCASVSGIELGQASV